MRDAAAAHVEQRGRHAHQRSREPGRQLAAQRQPVDRRLLVEAPEAEPLVRRGRLRYFWSLQHAQLYSEPERLAAAGYLEVEQATPQALHDHPQGPPGARAVARRAPQRARGDARAGAPEALLRGRPQALARVQLESHRRRLAEYEAIGEELPAAATDAKRLALEAGIRHEHEWIRFWADVADRPGD